MLEFKCSPDEARYADYELFTLGLFENIWECEAETTMSTALAGDVANDATVFIYARNVRVFQKRIPKNQSGSVLPLALSNKEFCLNLALASKLTRSATLSTAQVQEKMNTLHTMQRFELASVFLK